MPELVAPTVTLHAAWLEAHAEWGPGRHEDGFGVTPADDVTTASGFATWVTRLTDPSAPRLHRWIVSEGRVLGGIALRWGTDDYISWAGNLGYGIRPSARRRGLATWAITQIATEARAVGLAELIAVCAPDNTPSARTLLQAGATFEGPGNTPFGPSHRYRLPLPHRAAT